MYTVMIVDDEKSIRNNLPHALDFRSLGFQVSALAKNGRDALEQLEKAPVDLVFLDVCMPVLDGVGFLRELSSWEEEKRPFVVMLSGYSEFEYARAAIRYGVKGYLLKPVDEDEAQPLLLDIRRELDGRAQRRAEAGIGERVRLLRELYHGANADRERLRGNLLLYAVCLDGTAQGGGLAAMREILEGQLPGGNEAFFRSQGSVVAYLLPASALEQSQGSATLYGRHVSRILRQRGCTCALLFDEEIFERPESAFRIDCEEHLYRMMTELFWGGDAVLSAGTPARCLTPSSEMPLENEDALLEALSSAVREADEEELHAAFEDLMRAVEENRLHFVLLQGVSYRLYYALSGVLPRSEAVTRLRPMDLREAPVFLRFLAWREALWAWLREALALAAEEGRQRGKGIAGQAAAYVREHFREPVSLKSVAAVCFVSPTHLGRCFQREMGVSFKQFVNDLRLKEAKRLLLQTDLRVYEIAEAAGFGESKRFVEKFTACFGCTPAEYRKDRAEQEEGEQNLHTSQFLR